ncbi:nucleotide-sugar transporter-domain-containing protein [Ochromonadaceae sp. CCMP2298]|nr:nucleotide-sugar transporter-domain-containing protein [Ochromonadaceae sp. CCMP2298]
METNFSLRTIILIALCLQNAVYTVMRKYSTQYEDVSAHEILIVAEVIKILFSVYMIFNETDPAQSDSQGKGVNKLLWLLKNSGKMLMLAVIYGAMNILSFVALQYIGAGEFTICAQLKILTTAGFAVVVLGRTLTPTKWRSLVLLVLGCILVASPSFNSEKGGNPALGYMAVMVEVCLSGFASIYFEKVVKSTTELVTIWERNFQLGFYSLLMYGGIIVYQSYQAGVEIEGGVEGEVVRAAWSGWSLITLSVAVLGAAGGLLVAATLKYADAILKTLASAGAIVIATLLGHYFLSGPLDLIIALGSCVAIVAISDYTLDATPA